MELAQTIGVIITIVVSVISLIISILAFIQQKPKLTCEIVRAYYGPAQLKDNMKKFYIAAGIEITVQNPSPANITIYDLKLKIGKECYQYLLPQDGDDQNITFFYSDNGKLYGSGWAIPYNTIGYDLPFKINSYDAILPTFVFHNIPNSFHGKKHGILIIKTTAGKLKRRIKLSPFDINTVEDWNEVNKFMKSELK
ncbi:hypothetical protein [Treponema sp.]|uniref:hypothetical protein n=1 Tax=Treponema sp. TaxID=166 RepID=UPI00258016A3|nr:hypothetical protein [Treponema sp.]